MATRIANGTTTTYVEHLTDATPSKKQQNGVSNYEWKIVWLNVVLLGYMHVAGLYGFYLLFTSANVLTLLWIVALHFGCNIGITAGAHRLWAHKSYKARWLLRLVLMLLHTTAFQEPLLSWVRNHRVHHKFSETDADPHNSRRGLFFSHIGWLLVRKHPDVAKKGTTVDTSDLEADALLVFQKKYFLIFGPVMAFVLPAVIPYYFWNETSWNSWHCAAIFRFILTLNVTLVSNSLSHAWGAKPYDRNIKPVDNLAISVISLGDGSHNYHHVFPWDYRSAELCDYTLNVTTNFIDLCARMGLARDLKTAKSELVRMRALRTGDGSLINSDEIWGWNNPDSLPRYTDGARILTKRNPVTRAVDLDFIIGGGK